MSKTPAAPLDAIVQIVEDATGRHVVDANSPAVNFVRFGLFDGAFVDNTGALKNDIAETDNFVGSDSRRFYFRVTDRSRAGSGRVSVTWRTVALDLKRAVDEPADTKITLLEAGRGTGVFVSKALMVVNTEMDKQPVHSGLPDRDPDGGGVRTSGMSNYRIRRASMLDFMELNYSPPPRVVGTVTNRASTGIFTPLFQRKPDARRRLPVHIFILRNAVGGKPVVEIDAKATIWNRDLRIASEVYERLGIQFDTVPAAVDAKFNPQIVQGGSPRVFQAVLVDPPRGLDTNNVLTESGRNTLITPSFPGLPDTVRVYFADQLAENAAGLSSSDAITRRDQPHNSTSFLDPLQRRAHTTAHEISHVLTAKPQGDNQGHFKSPGAPLTEEQNLMHSVTVEPKDTEVFKSPKRLWDAKDGDQFNQVEVIMGSRFLRPF